MRLSSRIVEEFKLGVVTRVEGESVPLGAAEDALNWMTHGDHIELRGGQALTGTEVVSSSPVTGLRVTTRFDGTEVPFYTHDRKVKYFDDATDSSIEVGTDMLPVAASGEEMSLENYHSLAGAFLYLSSPSSSFYKIPIANPGSAVDQSMTNHRGRFRIKQNRTFLWRRKGTDKVTDATGLYGSYIDKDELSDYTQTTNENIGTGNGVTKTFADTLVAVTGKKTCHYVVVTDGTETFNDDRNGGLVGSAGGTGTINYATGAISVTFFAAPANLQAITCDYYTEDSTSGGILDFTKSTPRTAGQGFSFRQDDGGADFQNIGSIDDAEFCFHSMKTWRLTLSSDDTAATNLIFRSQVGIENWRAMFETGDGLYYVDSLKKDNAYIRILKPSQFVNNREVPKSISDLLSLSPYRFDKGVVFEWGDYIVVCCRTTNSTINNRMLFYHTLYKSWDVTDMRADVLDDFGGTLLAGDSGSPNLYTLFSGLSDEDSEIPNYWITGNDDMGTKGEKTAGRLLVRGGIDRDQELDVYISLDRGAFVKKFTVSGRGSYVSSVPNITIGSPTAGTNLIGGGTSPIQTRSYEVEFLINTDKFKRIRLKFQATKVGYASVSGYEIKDPRYKGRHSLPASVST
ncbi:MAG: hypothetical protein WC822_06740 [Candidatus Paceibacterota bacterium]|jgi:hypothetical protein